MKITGISIWHVDLTSHKTYYMSDGKTCDTVESVVVRLDTDAGIAGWGEHCVIPHYLPSFSRGIAPAITEMAPEILGHNPMGAAAFMHRLDKWLIGHDAAKSAVDMALWDINAKVAGATALQLTRRKVCRCYSHLSLDHLHRARGNGRDCERGLRLGDSSVPM